VRAGIPAPDGQRLVCRGRAPSASEATVIRWPHERATNKAMCPQPLQAHASVSQVSLPKNHLHHVTSREGLFDVNKTDQ
jgi:hypothetical protein